MEKTIGKVSVGCLDLKGGKEEKVVLKVMRHGKSQTENPLPTPQARTRVLAYADGSAEFSFTGKCKVLCAVTGPVSVKHRNELYNKAFVSVKFDNLRQAIVADGAERRPHHGPREVRMEAIMRGCFEKAILTGELPLTAVEITCQLLGDERQLKLSKDRTGVTSNSGSHSLGGFYTSLCASINAASLALASAGVPMQHSLCALVFAFVPGDTIELVVNPTEDDYDRATCLFLIVVNNQKQLVCLHSQGAYEPSDFALLHSVSLDKANEVFSFMRNILSS